MGKDRSQNRRHHAGAGSRRYQDCKDPFYGNTSFTEIRNTGDNVSLAGKYLKTAVTVFLKYEKCFDFALLLFGKY